MLIGRLSCAEAFLQRDAPQNQGSFEMRTTPLRWLLNHRGSDNLRQTRLNTPSVLQALSCQSDLNFIGKRSEAFEGAAGAGAGEDPGGSEALCKTHRALQKRLAVSVSMVERFTIIATTITIVIVVGIVTIIIVVLRTAFFRHTRAHHEVRHHTDTRIHTS